MVLLGGVTTPCHIILCDIEHEKVHGSLKSMSMAAYAGGLWLLTVNHQEYPGN